MLSATGLNQDEGGRINDLSSAGTLKPGKAHATMASVEVKW
jgi:hypothetical protein